MKEKKYYSIRVGVFWICLVTLVIIFASTILLISRANGKTEETVRTEYGAIVSELENEDECYLCGSSDASMMDYYRKFDTVGVVGLNQWVVMDLRLKEYDSEGNCVEKEGSSSSQNNMQGVEYSIDATPSRGKASATIKSTDGMFYESTVRKHLCQKCLDKVVSTLERDTVDGAKDFLPFCVVDFETLELYPVQREQHSYFVRDYWVQIESIDEEIELEVFYLPEK